MDAIEFKNLEKSYKISSGKRFQALKPLNLTIPKGEFFGLLGHNGAGKTTAINILAGVNKPTSGDIIIHGHSVSKQPSITKQLVGVVQQELLVDSFFPLKVMLTLQSKFYGAVPDMEWIDLLLEKLMLAEHVKKTTRELSGGMKRRMMIARALVHKPKVLILDEPTAGVDVQLRHSMWEFVRELHQTGMTIILTTHYLEEAEQLCGRIGIMKNGELITLKKNKDLLALGGQQKIEFILRSPSGIINEEMLLPYLKKNLINENYNIELMEDFSQPACKKIKISFRIASHNVDDLIAYSEKIKKIAQEQSLVIDSFSTQQPSLEEVFLKINEGTIPIGEN